MAEQQAGWYSDPSGDASKLRYWDGNQWTNDFTSAIPPAQPSEPEQAAQAYQPYQVTQPAQPYQQYQPPVYLQGSTYGYTSSGQPVYPQPQYYVQVPAQSSNGLAIASLVCGIVGLCPYAFGLLSIIAIILGATSIKVPSGRGMAIAGLVLGIAGIALWVLVFLGILVSDAFSRY